MSTIGELEDLIAQGYQDIQDAQAIRKEALFNWGTGVITMEEFGAIEAVQTSRIIAINDKLQTWTAKLTAMKAATPPAPEEPVVEEPVVEEPVEIPTEDPEDQSKIVEAHAIMDRLTLQWYQFANKQIPELEWTSNLASGQARLQELGWPPWKPPAVVLVEEPEEPTAAPTVDLSALEGILRSYGVTAPLQSDLETKERLRGILDKEGLLEGVLPEALDEIHLSPADPVKAAELARALSIGVIGTVAALGSAGILAETVSLGQIETVGAVLMKILDASGVPALGSSLFMAQFEAGIVEPTRQYYQSQYRPKLPGSADLVRFLVREVIPKDRFDEALGYQGFSQEWTDAYWEAHWVLPGIDSIIRSEHRGDITKEQRDLYLVLHDYKPEPRPGMDISDQELMSRLFKTRIPRVDVRRGFKLGAIDEDEMLARYKRLGFEDDAPLMSQIQKQAAFQSLQDAVIREAMYALTDFKITNDDFLQVFNQVRGTFDEPTLWITRAQIRRIRFAKDEEEEPADVEPDEAAEEALE